MQFKPTMAQENKTSTLKKNCPSSLLPGFGLSNQSPKCVVAVLWSQGAEAGQPAPTQRIGFTKKGNLLDNLR